MAAALGAKLPHSVAFRLLGGERGLEQVPDPHERQEMLARCLRKIAGPQGDTLQQAERALEILEVHQGPPKNRVPVHLWWGWLVGWEGLAMKIFWGFLIKNLIKLDPFGSNLIKVKITE